MNDVLKTIKSRRSVRKYKQEQISQEELDSILEAGIYAPTAHNDQPWHFTVIQNQELLHEINETVRKGMATSDVDWIRAMGSNPNFQVTYNAPTLIVVSGRKDGISWKVDCAAAIQNMLIAAESLHIGSVWLGLLMFFLKKEEEVKKLGIPENYEPFYGVVFGYNANENEQAAPKRNMDVVNFIR
jgi:nitroreductase